MAKPPKDKALKDKPPKDKPSRKARRRAAVKEASEEVEAKATPPAAPAAPPTLPARDTQFGEPVSVLPPPGVPAVLPARAAPQDNLATDSPEDMENLLRSLGDDELADEVGATAAGETAPYVPRAMSAEEAARWAWEQTNGG